MNKDPLVSIIINCYNGEKYLREAIDSIYSQTYTNWEIIFWDNASTDSSSMIAKSYDTKIKYFRSQKNHSLGYSRSQAVKKINGDLYKVCLYTNNQGPKEWAKRICSYIDNKIQYKLFDKHIGAYIVDNIQIELQRTTHEKTIDDFFKVTKFGSKTQICFIDDLYHKKMDHDNVYYIQIEPYTVILPINLLVDRFYNNNIGISYNIFNNYIHKFMNRYNMSELQQDSKKNLDHKLNGKELMKHLENFLSPINKSTQHNKYETKNKTIKR